MKYKISAGGIQIAVSGSANPMIAHLAKPESVVEEFPAIIVLMELFGVNDNIREITNQIAKMGYIAIAPDFYHRTKDPGDIPYGDEGRKYGFEQLNQTNRETIFNDIAATIDYLKLNHNVFEDMGIVGFSVGGHMAYLAATKYRFAAVACFYAGWLTNTDIKLSQPNPTIELTDGLAKNKSELLYFNGANDRLIDKAQLDKMESVWKENNVPYEMIIYPDTSHGFFCDQRPDDFNKNAHDDAWEKLENLFTKTLKK